MRILAKINYIFAWALETIVGVFFPMLLILSSLFVDTNEGNRLIQIPGFFIVLILLYLSIVSMFLGVLFFGIKKHQKKGQILLIIGTALFIISAAGIAMCTMHISGAVSLKVTGEERMNAMKLFYRHLSPVFIPVFCLFSQLCINRANDKELYDEAIEEIQNGKIKTLSIDEDSSKE